MNGRDLPWRRTRNPYHILVSEMMLQQTGVARVLGKYSAFLRSFPDIRSLARAPLRDVLAAWKGLGYNRRALYLKRAAERIVQEHHGRIPRTLLELRRLPGLGTATASAVLAFAWNIPVVFIETNIRRAVIHHFFPGESAVTDSMIRAVAEMTLDRADPQGWYSALMDYGSVLKATAGNPNRRSAQYRKQSPFEGSARQVRGMIIAKLLERQGLSRPQITRLIKERTDSRSTATPAMIRSALDELIAEGFLEESDGKCYFI